MEGTGGPGGDTTGETTGPGGRTPPGDGERGEHRVDIGGDAHGTVIAGNHNLVVDARRGSTVTLLTPRTRPQPVRRSRVRLLPRRGRDPLGRAVQLSQLADAVRAAGEAGGLVQVWGPAGVGKSTLLRHAAGRLEPGPDGVLFLNAAGREVLDLAQDIFEACYDAPGYAPTETELRRLMTGVRVTVYVDEADLATEDLLTLADTAPDAIFVLASREPSLLGDGEVLELPGLDRAAALELLAREVRCPLPPGELAAAEALCEMASGRPLLLLRAAGLARYESPGELTLPRPADVRGVLPMLLDRIDAAAGNTLRLLAALDGAELHPSHVGPLCGLPDPAAVCDGLAGLGLVLATGRGYRITADALAEVRRRPGEPFAAGQLCDHFTRWAALPGTTPADVADHGRALEVTAALAEQQGRPDLAVALARAVSPLLARSLRFGVWGRLLDQGQSAARQADDAPATAYFTHERAIRWLLVGRRAAAAVLLAEAVVLWRQLGDTGGVDAALNAQQYTPQAPGDQGAPSAGDSPADPGAASPQGDGGGAATGPGEAPPPADGGTGAGAGPGSAPPQASDGGPAADGATAPAGPDPGASGAVTPDAAAQGAAAPDPAASASAAPDPAATGSGGSGYGGDPAGTAGTAAPPAPAPDAASAHASPDPGAASTAVPPPGADGVVTAGSAGAGAGTGGGAAVGAGLAKAFATLAATLVAVAVGAAVIQANQDPDPRPAASDSRSWEEPDTTDPEPEPEAEPDTWEPEPEPESSPAWTNDLAGVWNTSSGMVQVTESGDGSYAFRVQPPCEGAGIVSVEVSGGDGSYSGVMPVWDEASCSHVGDADMAITVADDGSTAEMTTTSRSDGTWQCLGCGTQSWTRVS